MAKTASFGRTGAETWWRVESTPEVPGIGAAFSPATL